MGQVHKFVNKTNKTTHMLCLITPAGMEKMFEGLGKPVTAGHFLPLTSNDIRRTKTNSKYSRKVWTETISTRLFRLVLMQLV